MVDLMVSEQQSGAAGKGVPAGFKMTEVGVIPEDWGVTSISEIATIRVGKDVDEKRISADLDNKYFYPVFSNTVDEPGIYGYYDYAEYVGNAVTVVGRGVGLGTAICRSGGFGAIGRLIVLFPKGNSIFLSNYINHAVDIFNESSGVPQLTGTALGQCKIAWPSLDEQTAIADALSDVDILIFKLEKKLVKKQAIKTATMQQLLTGKTRLPQFALRDDGSVKGYKKSELGDIPEDWVLTNIGQFTNCCAGGTPSTKISAYWGGTHPWMSSGELHLKQVYKVADYITDEGLANSSTKYVPKNSVLVGLAGQGKTRGTVAINRIELCTNQSIAAIFPSEHHSTEFLFYNLDNRYEELRNLSTGDGGRGGLNLTIIRKLHIAFPPKEEQTAIATILSDMDKDIQTLQQRLDKTRKLKQGMMQELLTGKTRLMERS